MLDLLRKGHLSHTLKRGRHEGIYINEFRVESYSAKALHSFVDY